MDVSGSMAASDVAPSRLGAAKQAATSASSTPSREPWTSAWSRSSRADSRRRCRPRITRSHWPRSAGLAPAAAPRSARRSWPDCRAITHKTVTVGRAAPYPVSATGRRPPIVLFSDGQTAAGRPAAAGTAARAAALPPPPRRRSPQQAGVHIDTVGVGTAAGTTVDVDGYHLFTALDADSLKSIAQATGGTLPPGFRRQPAQRDRLVDQPAAHRHQRQPLPLAGALIRWPWCCWRRARPDRRQHRAGDQSVLLLAVGAARLLVLPLLVAAWWLARRRRKQAAVLVTSIALVRSAAGGPVPLAAARSGGAAVPRARRARPSAPPARR